MLKKEYSEVCRKNFKTLNILAIVKIHITNWKRCHEKDSRKTMRLHIFLSNRILVCSSHWCYDYDQVVDNKIFQKIYWTDDFTKRCYIYIFFLPLFFLFVRQKSCLKFHRLSSTRGEIQLENYSSSYPEAQLVVLQVLSKWTRAVQFNAIYFASKIEGDLPICSPPNTGCFHFVPPNSSPFTHHPVLSHRMPNFQTELMVFSVPWCG